MKLIMCVHFFMITKPDSKYPTRQMILDPSRNKTSVLPAATLIFRPIINIFNSMMKRGQHFDL